MSDDLLSFALPWSETQTCHLCGVKFAPPNGRKIIFRHWRNIHGLELKTSRSHLLGRKRNTEVIPDEDAEAEAEELGLTEAPTDPLVEGFTEEELTYIRLQNYMLMIMDGAVSAGKGVFYEDFVAPLEEEVAELKAELQVKREAETIDETETRAELDETRAERDELKRKNKELDRGWELEIDDHTETKKIIEEKDKVIEEKDKIIADLMKQLEEAKKAKEPEPEPEEPKEPKEPEPEEPKKPVAKKTEKKITIKISK